MPDKVSAIIVAAGKGERMGSSGVPKQFIELAGVPMLGWSVSALSSSDIIDEIVIVSSEEWMERAVKTADEYCRHSSCRPAIGGRTRQQSVYNGLKSASGPDVVLIHDAARPFVSTELAERTIEAARQEGAATASLKPADTIKLWDEGSASGRNLPRERLRTIQTPQAFRAVLLQQAHERAIEEDYQATDDTDLLERTGQRTIMVEGSAYNLKITDAADLELARAMVWAGLVPSPVKGR